MSDSQTSRPKPTESTAPNCEVDDQIDTAIEEHLRCCLCGTDLYFEQAVDFAALTVVETSECPSCRIRSRARTHALH